MMPPGIKRVPDHSVTSHRLPRCEWRSMGVPMSRERQLWGRRPNILPGRRLFPFIGGQGSTLAMKPEEQTEEDIILAFAVSDDALEFAASPKLLPWKLYRCAHMPRG